jgi:hypothetical protein
MTRPSISLATVIHDGNLPTWLFVRGGALA